MLPQLKNESFIRSLDIQAVSKDNYNLQIQIDVKTAYFMASRYKCVQMSAQLLVSNGTTSADCSQLSAATPSFNLTKQLYKNLDMLVKAYNSS